MGAVEEYRQVMASAWDAELEQLSAGRFECDVSYAVTETTIFFREKINSSFRTFAALNPKMMGFGVSNESSMEKGRWWNSTHPRDGLPYGGVGTNLDAVFPKGNDKFVVLMNEETFRTKYEILAGCDASFLDEKSHFLEMPRPSVLRIQQELSEEMERQTSDATSSDAEAMENRLVEILVSSVRPPLRVTLTDAQRHHLVDRATYLAEKTGYSRSIASLCLDLKCSRRTLEFAFRDCLGCSPSHYLKRRRLNRCRQLLAFSDPKQTSVNEVASSLGFVGSGRFAADYKALFGEFPYKTLSKPAPLRDAAF